MKQNYSVSGNDLRKRFRNCCYLISLFLIYFLGGLQNMQAQQMERMPGVPVVCPAKFEDQNSRMAMMQLASKKFQTKSKSAVTAELLITFGPGAQGNAAVEEAFQFALDIWSQEIVSSVPIRIFADFADLGAGVLASAGPTTLISNFTGAPQADVFYPVALANSLAGEDLAPDLEFDLVVNIGNGIPWYFGTDGNTPAGQFDFVTVALHEAGHGLGFVDGGNVNNNTGVGNINNGGNPFIFDTFIVDSAENSVLDIPNPSVELGDFFTSGDVFVNGTFAVAALGGTLPELFAPNPFQGGSSIAHWDEAAFPAGDPNSLMSPQVGTAESNFNIGDITRGHFRDMGWVLAEQPPINAIPAAFNEEIFINTTSVLELTVSNTSDAPATVSTGTSPGANIISSFSPESFTLAPAEVIIVEVTLNTTGIVKGIYEESIELTIDGFDGSVSVPVTVRVLDGTEAPMIVVTPESFDETIQQLTVETRDLSIENTGDDDLNFSITVNDNPQLTFQSRVAASKAAIAASGFTSGTLSASSPANPLAALVGANAPMNKVVTSLYAEDFEGFALGDIVNQFGWFGRFENNWTISNANAFEGAQHLRGISDGLGPDRAAAPLALSPVVVAGNEPFMVLSARVNVQGSGVSWEIIPQSPTAGLVVTRLRFNGDGSIDVLDGASSSFVPLAVTTPTGYFDLRIIIDKDDLGLTIFFDDSLVYSGTGITPLIESVALLSDMAVVGSTMDIDNFEITDGDPNAFFLSVSPAAGVVPFGGETVASVKFDARTLEPGDYSATINIVSDDTNSPSIDIPVSLTVLSPPTIEVAPNTLSATVDVLVDIPPTKTETITITNSGQSPLDFTASQSPRTFTPPSDDNTAQMVAALDMTKYGVGKATAGTVKRAGLSKSGFKSARAETQLENALIFTDSIFYDTGINFPDDFVGLQGPAIALAVRFEAESDFTLNAVRNAYRTEALTEAVILLEVYRGGATPDQGELLLTQPITLLSTDGIFLEEELNAPQDFSAGESFWVVHKFPEGIDFPQGVDDNATARADTYYFSSDGGASYTNLTDFVFLTRALSGEEPYITLEPAAGTVAPGSSVDVQVTFDGATLPNGTFNADILINSNDPVTPTTAVATTFEVSGQISEIAVSDELVLFNSVFLGAQSQRTFTITNNGLALLNISDIASDNGDFVAEPTSGVLEAGKSLEVNVTFTPSALGSINGIITITSDADNAETVEVIVNGVGTDPPVAVLDPQEVSATTDAGTTVEAEITLRNDGNSPLTFSFPNLAVAAALADPNVKLNNTEIKSFEGFNNPTKALKDTRIGSVIEYGLGTDNGFGYSWIDSDEPGGPVNNFFDITGIGTDITAVLGADGTASGPLAFPFEYYGASYETVFINANGFLAMQAPTTAFTFFNEQIPVDDGVNNVIAGLWTDLEPQNGGSVHVASFLDAFVVQWTNAPVFSSAETGTVTFQIILFDDGTIDVYYADVSSASFLDSATVGIENADGSDGAQVAFNTEYVKEGLALRFIKPAVALTPFISSIDPVSGVVAAGGSRTLSVTLDATNLNDGTFFDELTVSSNAPDKSTSTALFELTVIGTPEIQATPDALDFEPIFVGLSSEASFSLTNIGTKALEISGISNGNADFTVDFETPVTLEPGESTEAFVAFAPSTVGAIADAIMITSNDGVGNASLEVPLTGVGVDPPVIEVSPESIDLTLTRGQSATEIVTLQNTGGSALNYAVAPPSLVLEGTATLLAQQYENGSYERIRSKQAADNRVGPTFVNASGGPGTFGYTWKDNNSGGPAYEFMDISATGQQANVGADGDETVALPFGFSFYGEVQNTVTIAANGFLTFAPLVGNNFTNLPIPNVANPNFFIAPMWSDIEPQDGTGVFYQGTADYFIVQYENVPGFGFPPFLPIPDPVTFQVILFPDGSFKMQYKNVNSTLRTSSTVGIEGPEGLSGLQVIFNNEYLTDELAVTFTPPISGTLEPGESVEVPIEFETDQLEADATYVGNVSVSSNDPVSPVTNIPVTLEVLRGPEVVSLTLINPDTNQPIGPLNDGDIINLADFGTNKFNVVANVGELPVGSVIFDYNGTEGFRTENVAPFALAGDSSGNFKGMVFPVGPNTVTATPFSGRGGSGESGLGITVNFEVVNEGGEELISFSLVNTTTNQVIGNLADGDVIDLNNYPGTGLGIVAETILEGINSVVFDFNGSSPFQIENTAPYALSGDSSGNFNATNFETGINTVTASAYTSKNGGGVKAASVTINFEVIPENLELANRSGRVHPNPVDGIANFTLEGAEPQVLTATLYNLSGQVVYPSFDFNLNDQGNGFMDVTDLSQGIYVLRLTDSNGKVISQVKVVKK
ncbi:choice-of-anchor D domain-containing protein [Flavobacteriaceae bacterium 3-367]